MSNPKQLWEAYALSKRTKQLPSDIYFIHDELAAWCFNRAVTSFGAEVEADLDTIDEKNPKSAELKRQMRLNKWLGIEQTFRDPLKR